MLLVLDNVACRQRSRTQFLLRRRLTGTSYRIMFENPVSPERPVLARCLPRLVASH